MKQGLLRQFKQAYGRIPEYGNRLLKIVYNESTDPWTVVTVFFDRTMGKAAMRPFIEFDPDVDAGYIRLTTAQVEDSVEIAPGIVLDFDKEKQLVGVEVLSVHQQMDGDIKVLPQEIQDYVVLLKDSVSIKRTVTEPGQVRV